MIDLKNFESGQRLALNTSVGTHDLCCWQPAPDEVWIQTRRADFARKLSQIHGGRLVAVGVSGGYLRTFAFRRHLAWAVRLCKRYLGCEMPIYAHIIEPAASVSTDSRRPDAGDHPSNRKPRAPLM